MEVVVEPAIREQQENAPIQSEGGTSARAIGIYAALSNKDSFQIFCLASFGIHATTEVLEQHKFSRKRYYVRLKELIAIGLVQKEGRFYRHTQLGKTVYENQVRALQHVLSAANQCVTNDFGRN